MAMHRAFLNKSGGTPLSDTAAMAVRTSSAFFNRSASADTASSAARVKASTKNPTGRVRIRLILMVRRRRQDPARRLILPGPVDVVEPGDHDPVAARRLRELPVADVEADVMALEQRSHTLRAEEDQVADFEVVSADGRAQLFLCVSGPGAM